MKGYDGRNKYYLKAGEYCIICKNNLARYHKQKQNDQFEKVLNVLDTEFLIL